MNDALLFSETQRFNRWLLWGLALAINCFFIPDLVKGWLGYDVPPGDSGALPSLITTVLIMALLMSIQLDTRIREDGIYVRFFPFINRFKKYGWDELAQVQVRQYNPIAEYGGWGFRLGLFGRGRAYNISGNMGIQLVFTDGSRLLIGTRKPGEVAGVLRQAGFDPQ